MCHLRGSNWMYALMGPAWLELQLMGLILRAVLLMGLALLRTILMGPISLKMFNATYGACSLASTYGAWIWRNDIEKSQVWNRTLANILVRFVDVFKPGNDEPHKHDISKKKDKSLEHKAESQ
jgi:hypothetical protein